MNRFLRDGFWQSCTALSGLALVAVGCGDAPASEEVVSTVRESLISGDRAFIRSNGTTANGTADSSFNSTGGVNSTTRLSAGSYRVDFPNLASGTATGQNVQVSTGHIQIQTSHGGIFVYCDDAGWTNTGSTFQVSVKCYNWAGTPTDGNFGVAVQRRTGTPGPETSYAFATAHTSPSYTPRLDYQWNSNGGNVTINREGVGTYLVFFPAQTSTAAHVVEASSYVWEGASCASGPGNSETDARVRCFNRTGALEDMFFSVAYSKKSPNDIGSYSFATVTIGNPPTVANSSGGVASGCSNEPSPTQSPVTASYLNGDIRVHFPEMSTNFVATNVMVVPYGTTTRILCGVQGWGNETGGAYADIACFQNASSRAPFGTKFQVAFSSTLFIPC